MKKILVVFAMAFAVLVGAAVLPMPFSSAAEENVTGARIIAYAPLVGHVVTAPTNPTPASGNASQAFALTATWNPSVCDQGHVVTYRFYYSLNQADIFSGNGHNCGENLYYKFYGLMPKTKYYWGVKAVCSGDVSSNSAIWNFTTVASEIVTPPSVSAPANKAVDQSLSPIFIWKTAKCNVNHVLSYTLYYSKSEDPFVSSGIDCKDSTSLQAHNLEEGVTYYWGVKVTCAGGVSATTPVLSFTTMIKDAVSAPTLSSPADGSANQLLSPTFNWNEAKCTKGHAVTYTLYYDIARYPLVIPGISAKTTSISVTGLSTNSKYYWRVKAVCSGGEEAMSETHSFTTTSEVLPALVLTSPAKNSSVNNKTVTFQWNGIDDPRGHAINYYLFYGTKSNAFETGTKVSCGPETVSTVDNLSYDTTYFWTILAECSNGAITRSEEWSFKTLMPGAETYTLNLRVMSLTKIDANKYEFRETQKVRPGNIIRIEGAGTLGRCQDKSVDVFITATFKGGTVYFSLLPDGSITPSFTQTPFVTGWTPCDFPWTLLLEREVPAGKLGTLVIGKLTFKVMLVPPEKKLKDVKPAASITLDVQSDMNETVPGTSLNNNIGNMKYAQTTVINPDQKEESIDLWMQGFRLRNVKNGDHIKLKMQIPLDHVMRTTNLHYAAIKFQRLSLAANINVIFTALNGTKSTLIAQGSANDTVYFGNLSPEGGVALDTLEIDFDVKSLGVNSDYEDLIFTLTLCDYQQMDSNLLDWSGQILNAVVAKQIGDISELIDAGL